MTPRRPRRSPRTNPRATPPKVALALAGGGPLGAIYEIGALCALEEALSGFSLADCNHYVGVSAGGFIAAGLANGLSPHDLCALFIDSPRHGQEAFDPSWLMRPAYAEWLQRLARVPDLGWQSLWAWGSGRRNLLGAMEQLGPLLPTGLFSAEEVHRQIARLFNRPGRTNDFRKLKHKLTLVATHLDSGEAAPFGREGWDHVPISRAIAASAALPGLFPPVEIDGKHYVDGALKKTMHATVALEEGVDVMFCLNPLVPFEAEAPEAPMPSRGAERPHRRASASAIPSLVDGGFPAVMNQTFRSLIHSRLELGMKQYERVYPDTAILLLEPDHRDAEFYLANTFSYRQRRELTEHAYQQTRQHLLSRRAEWSALLAPHGMGLSWHVLTQPRSLLGTPPQTLSPPAPRHRLHQALDQLNADVQHLQSALEHDSLQWVRPNTRKT
ncbi:patatin-like phospholipase family protein [Hydrogenophaga soli]